MLDFNWEHFATDCEIIIVVGLVFAFLYKTIKLIIEKMDSYAKRKHELEMEKLKGEKE